MGGLYDGTVVGPRVVTGHRPRVVRQGSCGEVWRQGSCSLEGGDVVVVVEVGGRDQVDGVERLVVTVAMVVEALVHLVHVVDVSQAAGLVQSGGGAGGTWLFES